MLRRKTLISATALLALVIAIVVGLIRSPKALAESSRITDGSLPVFEVASVQPSSPANEGTSVRFAPGRLTLANWTTKSLITFAYNTTHIVGGPAWTDTERYIIDVKVDDSRAYKSGKLVGFNSAGRFPPGLRREEFMLMLQSLLADRFGLKFHHEPKYLPVYALVIGKNGLKLHEATPGDSYPDGIIDPDGLPVGPHKGTGQKGHLTGQALPMSTVAEILSQQLGRTVVDKTGLTGDYDFTLEWTPDATNPDQQRVANSCPQESSAPSIFTAIEQQLGLKLELQEIPTDLLVIDQARKPRKN